MDNIGKNKDTEKCWYVVKKVFSKKYELSTYALLAYNRSPLTLDEANQLKNELNNKE